MGWFYGFKLHLVVNHKGELLSSSRLAMSMIATPSSNLHNDCMASYLVIGAISLKSSTLAIAVQSISL